MNGTDHKESAAAPVDIGRRDPQELLFDFFKHMTTLSLLTIGGALTISQIPDTPVRPFSLLVSVLLLAAAGIAGFAGMDEIVKARFDGKDVSRTIRFYRRICPAAFGLGAGAFLAMFFHTHV